MSKAFTTKTFQHSLRHFVVLNCLVIFFPAVQAQLAGKIDDKPIAVGYARDIGPVEVMDYAKKLMERLKIGETMREELTPERMQAQSEQWFPKVEHPLYGVAYYMVTGPIPSFEKVSFQQVVDEADARRLVDGRKLQYGESGSMEDLGNGCFKVVYKRTRSFLLPEGTDETAYTSLNGQNPSSVWKYEYKIVEKEGKKFVEKSQSMLNLFRFHDNMLYEGAFDGLFTMELPSADAITSGVDGSTDLGFDAYFDRIPHGIRMLGWNMLTAAVGSQLQQRDDELETSYAMRRNSGDMGLALTKAVLFDVDHSEGWLMFASEDEPSIQGELRIRARDNSQLSKQLLDAGGVSRFAPILSDNAAVTAHLCARLPEEASAALLATGTWLQEAIGRETNNDAAMVTAATALSETLVGIAEHRNFELLLKAGWTKESGGVLYGGLQLNDNPQLLSGIHHFLTQTPAAPPNVGEIVALTEVDGVQMIRIQLPADGVESIRTESGMTISHIWLAHQNSCLWFAAGTENSKEIIRQSLARCTEGSLAARTPLVSLRVDMERWLSYPQDDPAGIARLPHYLDENAWWFPPNPMGFMMPGGYPVPNADKPTPIMQRAFDLGGSQQFWLTLEADDSGILLQISLGEALANQMLARMIDALDNMMMEEAQAAQATALEEAGKSVPIPEPPAE